MTMLQTNCSLHAIWQLAAALSTYICGPIGQGSRVCHVAYKMKATRTLLNRLITAQWEGMGDVGLARYEPDTTSSMPDHKGFKLQ